MPVLRIWTDRHYQASRHPTAKRCRSAWRCGRAKLAQREYPGPKRSAVRRTCTCEQSAPDACGKMRPMTPSAHDGSRSLALRTRAGCPKPCSTQRADPSRLVEARNTLTRWGTWDEHKKARCLCDTEVVRPHEQLKIPQFWRPQQAAPALLQFPSQPIDGTCQQDFP